MFRENESGENGVKSTSNTNFAYGSFNVLGKVNRGQKRSKYLMLFQPNQSFTK